MIVEEASALLAVARRLAADAGCARPHELVPLTGGKNNRVFHVRTDGKPLVLKSYHRDARDTRDRLGHEWSFLTYVWERGVRNVPRPLAMDDTAGVALYPFIAGRKLVSTEIGKEAVMQAADFIVAANAAPRDVQGLAPGSEACFSLADHLATVDRRVARLDVLDPEAPHLEAANSLVRDRLRPAWEMVRARITAAPKSSDLTNEQIIVSPSDFGFHNAIADDDGAVTFIDFEYAGRDDPAKLVCDFFCCPEAPPPPDLRAVFIDRVAAGLDLPPSFAARAELLLDAYRIKWTCIVLNDFLAVGAARRAFALPGERAERCAAQLKKASHIFDGLNTAGIHV